ncbi:hypothetical protein T08_7001 [Trichinella sp. T8]|nr:hypothetical protein T08_7001 [Trichinella sp. T8]
MQKFVAFQSAAPTSVFDQIDHKCALFHDSPPHSTHFPIVPVGGIFYWLSFVQDYCNYLLFYRIGIFSLKKEILQICDISQSKSDLSKS